MSGFDPHGRACRPQHLSWVAQPRELGKLLSGAGHERHVVTSHLVHLEKACHEHRPLLRKVRVTIIVRVPRDFRWLISQVIILQPMSDPVLSYN